MELFNRHERSDWLCNFKMAVGEAIWRLHFPSVEIELITTGRDSDLIAGWSEMKTNQSLTPPGLVSFLKKKGGAVSRLEMGRTKMAERWWIVGKAGARLWRKMRSGESAQRVPSGQLAVGRWRY